MKRRTMLGMIVGAVPLIVPAIGSAAPPGGRPPVTIAPAPVGPPAAARSLAYPDPRVRGLTAHCTGQHRISYCATLENAGTGPTKSQVKLEVRAVAKKAKGSKSPTTVWQDVPVVLDTRFVPAGFSGPQTFCGEKSVPYFGNPQYRVEARAVVYEVEVSKSNNFQAQSVVCN